jgi:D-alanyl-D-alanine carboxypeptidase (penicillin-binding protein 5/6)
MTLLVKSANDVAVALARDNAGTEQGFVDKMNARARELGAENTRFRNPHGLTEQGQYSTARDMALIARAAWQRPEVRNFAMVRRLNFQHPDGSTTELENTNRLLDQMISATGLKTGTTRAAGYCLVASATAGEQDVIAVVLGSTLNRLNQDAGSLLVWTLQGLGAPVPDADIQKYGGSTQ